MTLSISVDGMASPAIGGTGASHIRSAWHYLLAALFCGILALVYARFSHGVHSPYMSFLFAIPLLCGSGVAMLCRLLRIRDLPKRTKQAWALAVASLSAASCLHGVFDIAGTASALLPIYLIAATGFAIIAFLGIWKG